MTPNTPTPSATAPAATPTYYVRDGGLHRKGGTCDCKVACTEVVTVKHVAHLMAQNAALLARCEELTKEWRDLASTDNAKYYAPINSDYERGYGDGIGFAKAYARRVLRDIADAALSRCSP